MSLLDDGTVTYPGTYQAVCLEVLTDRARVQVPQVFGNTVVVIFEFAGERPSPGDNGWVVFEAGLAEHPIWVGSESTANVVVPPIPPFLPVDGATGTVLTKQSPADNDVVWSPVPHELPVGGSVPQILYKSGAPDYSAAWGNAHGPASGFYSDFNPLVNTGLYLMNAAASNGPPGSMPVGALTVTAYSGVNVTQIFQPTSVATNGQIWTRSLTGGSWQAWVSLSRQLMIATGLSVPIQSLSGGLVDFGVWSVTPTVSGWVEVEVSVVYYGFSGGTLASFGSMLWTPNLNGADGQAYQTPTTPGANTGLAGGTWGRATGPNPFIFPVTGGSNYVVNFRAVWSPTSTNCYVQMYGSAKMFSNQ